MQKILLGLVLLICISITSGCGFHLRGHESLPPQLKVLYLQSDQPYSQFTKQLEKILSESGVYLVANPQRATITLDILTENFTQSPTTTGSNGQVTTYLLTDTVTFQLIGRNGTVIIGPQTITTTNNYSISSNQILGDTNAQESLEDDMRRDLVYQLLNRLRAYRTAQALQDH